MVFVSPWSEAPGLSKLWDSRICSDTSLWLQNSYSSHGCSGHWGQMGSKVCVAVHTYLGQRNARGHDPS